jgi:hypothetical protein
VEKIDSYAGARRLSNLSPGMGSRCTYGRRRGGGGNGERTCRW